MTSNTIIGYFWIIAGLFFLGFFGFRLLLQFLCIFIGFSLIFKGLRILAIDRVVYNYSRNYFNDQFKK
ncbi:MAG: hypothetical protein JO129_01470 [Candidatus Dependentiae bacterium]|nr:hypothetical protein [Candidatus Dependentiae bacterium]